ncbi:MAG: hypothetical protein JNJ50_06840 [Acidobacteria bacterium]|nr:hypothetical protein [Acidobacteriota bacterium]
MRRFLPSFSVALVCVFLLSFAVLGQSGRKQKKAEVQPPVQGVNQPEARTVAEPEAEPEKPKEQPKEKRSILVGSFLADLELPMYFADTAREGCMRELRDQLKYVELQQERNQTRSDAMKAAKDDDTRYVIWLELVYDRYGTGSMNGVDLRYTIFEPKTGRIAGAGSGFPVQPNSGAPIPPIGASRTQMYLDWAGRDVAQQVIKRLGLRPSI